MSQRRVIVAGAGPAGITAAIWAARGGARVTVLEKMKKPGKKLLLTGNGRCNLTNLSPGTAKAYERQEDSPARRRTVAGILEGFPVRETLAFFSGIGVPAVGRDSWVYPRSGQARSVLNALLSEAERLGVKMKYDAEVTRIFYDADAREWHAATDGWEYTSDSLVLACGGMAAPETGSDGGGFALARAAGHHVIPPVPALTGLVVPDPDIRLASGARTPAEVFLTADGKEAGSETGEIQWTDYGLSGIAVFQLSRRIAGMRSCRDFRIRVDLAPDLPEEEIASQMEAVLSRFGSRCGLLQLLCGYTHERTAAYLVKKDGAEAEAEKTGAAAAGERKTGSGSGSRETEPLSRRAARLLKRTELPVRGPRSFEHAQVTAGGADLTEVNPVTLESLLAPGLFFAGEMLDADGPCGGYNLQWAWSSGYAAGRGAAGNCRGDGL